MLRLSQIEHRQVALEIGRVDGPGAQGRLQIRAEMQPLPAGCDLQSLEQEIETAGRTARSPRSRVKRPSRQREAEHKHSRNPGLSRGSFAKLALGLRIKIVFQVSASK